MYTRIFTPLLFLFFSWNTPFIFSQNFELITQDVDTIWSGGTPGPIFAIANNVVPIVAGNPFASSSFPTYAVATTSNEGHIIAVGHEGLLTNNNVIQFDNLAFLINAFNWLDKGDLKTIKITSGNGEWVNFGNTAVLQSSLQSDGFNVSNLPGNITASALEGVGVVLVGNAWGEITNEELLVLNEFVTNGGGLLLAGLGWSWPNDLENYPMNRIANNFGIQWISGTINDPDNNFNNSPLFLDFYPNTQQFNVSGSCNLLADISVEYNTTLPFILQNEEPVRNSFTGANLFLKAATEYLPEESALRDTIYICYTNLISNYPELFTKGNAYNINSESAIAWNRERMHRNLRDAKNLLPDVIDEIGNTLELSERYLDVWNQFQILLLDNSQLDALQSEFIYNLLNKVPTELHNLGSISFRDYIGATFQINLGGIGGSVNTFTTPVNAVFENQFPDDISPGVTSIFCAAAAHEVNHIVDAFYVNGNELFKNRKNDLIAQAGDDNLNYLRSMIPSGFFTNAPQEFIASIANQWFTDSKKVLELGISRFDNARSEPINQCLYFMDIYTAGTDSTIFYNMDTEGNISCFKIPVGRDQFNHINSLTVCDTTWMFDVDMEGNVLGYTKMSVTSTDNLSNAKETKPFTIFPNPGSGILHIKNHQAENPITIEIHDCHGKQVLSSRNIDSGSSLTLPDFPTGIYLVSIHSGKQVFVERVVVND